MATTRRTLTMTRGAARRPPTIAVDTNILIGAWSKENAKHQELADLMDRLEFGTSEWAIPDPCLSEYYQAVTNRKKFKNPATPREALKQIEFWLALPHVAILCEFADEADEDEPGDDYWACFVDILEYAEIRGLDTFDARIAAICITHHVGELWTQDKDYAQFKGLRARDPLTGTVHCTRTPAG
jgi:uncharacterized protein